MFTVLRQRLTSLPVLLGFACIGGAALGWSLADGDAEESATTLSQGQERPLAQGELAVAAGAGEQLVSVRLRRSRRSLSGVLRVIDSRGRPFTGQTVVRKARAITCGAGCRRLQIPAGARSIAVRVGSGTSASTARLPVSWQRSGNLYARFLVTGAQATMRAQPSLRATEVVSSGPRTRARTDYRFRQPDRMMFQTDRGVQGVIVGDRRWSRVGAGGWRGESYGAGARFRVESWFGWTPLAGSARLLSISAAAGGRRYARVALYNPAGPYWLVLVVDLTRRRVVRERMVARGHFMQTRYYDFGRAPFIRAPE